MKPEIYISIISTFIALCALGLAVWQGRVGIRYNKLSTRPFLTTIYNEWHKNGEFELLVHNNGMGPARIMSFAVFLDNVDVSGDRYKPVKQAIETLLEGYSYSIEHGFLGKNHLMKVGDSMRIFKVNFEKDWPSREEMNTIINRLQLKITYESLYEQKYTMLLYD